MFNAHIFYLNGLVKYLLKYLFVYSIAYDNDIKSLMPWLTVPLKVTGVSYLSLYFISISLFIMFI